MAWATLILKYLSHLDATLTKRDSLFLQEAIEILRKGGEQQILEIVQEFNTIHIRHFPLSRQEQERLDEFRSKAQKSSQKLIEQNRVIESLTCELLAVDLASPLPSAFRRFDTAQWANAMREGLERCEQALEIVSKLESATDSTDVMALCCRAFYLGQQGEVHFYCRQLEKALAISESNLNIYSELSLRPSLENGDKARFVAYQAVTHKNIARAYRDLLRYVKAREHCEQALEFFQSQLGDNLMEQEAISLRNYASILRGLGEYAQAKKVCKQALEKFTVLRKFALTQQHEPWEVQDPYSAHIAMSLTTLASILWKFGHLSAARLRCEEGLALFLNLSAHQQRIYAPHKAILLYTTGNILVAIEKSKARSERNTRTLEAAKRFYETAIQVYDELSKYNEEQIFEPYKAATLRNLAETLFEIHQTGKFENQYLKLAKENFESAIQIYKRLLVRQESNTSLLIDIGVTQCLFGLLWESEGSKSKSRQLFQECVKNCEKGLKNLGEKEHYALHKSKIEPAYQRIIYEKAVSIVALSNKIESEHISQKSQQSKKLETYVASLIRLLETLRQEKLVSDFGDHKDEDAEDAEDIVSEDVIIQATQPDDDLWLQLFKFEGKISIAFQELSPKEMLPAAFLWIHATPEGVVCVTLKAGAFAVGIAPPLLAAQLEFLSQHINKCWDKFLHHLNVEGLHPDDAKHEAGRSLKYWGEWIFNLLPTRLQQFLRNNECATLFVSPCAKTINAPFEIIRIPSIGPKVSKSFDDNFLGLRFLITRVPSLSDLEHLLTNFVSTSSQVDGEILLVGDPKHSPATTQLPSDEFLPLYKARKLARRFGQGFADLQAQGELPGSLQLSHARPLTGTGAVKADILSCLERGQLRFWWHMGHGVGPKEGLDERRGPEFEYLALAGQEKLYAHEISEFNLEGAIVHFDCCVAGTIHSLGGGRFQSLPTAALASGAISVIASPFPMWEGEAVRFTFRLYAQVTLGRMNLGQAFLNTRRQMATKRNYKNNPLIWAPLVLWGNPYIRLSLPISDDTTNPSLQKRSND